MRAAALVLALLASEAGAGEPALLRETVHVSPEVEIVVPADSPVGASRIGEYSQVHFDGRFELSGAYTYGYITDDPAHDATYGELYLTFVPDAEQRARLPYWQRDGAVEEIEFADPEVVAAALIEPAQLAALKAGEVRSIRGRATLVVEDYWISIDCDSPTYFVAFVERRAASDLVASRELAPYSGC